ncbi:hypothetical protein HYFRA_00001544 [Hymenoscyphus fraxineus]|uniref:RING-type domain-containing protein n=1 Tax=Hymenoscyphus fraxineus TaxID=746836 RepID=A0A9N9L6W1_9HELO|nr:hypothetical protein HYFRA_00001544 [Hymenoscyphus fraxineus]
MPPFQLQRLKSWVLGSISIPHSKPRHTNILSESPLQEGNESEKCTICNSPVHTPRPDDNLTETLLILPCSHTFGSICITRWLENDSPHKDCPQCRRSMLYSKCGHLIRPAEVARSPKCVREEEMPEMCVVCRGDGVLGALRKRRDEEERQLREMREWLPGVWGGVCEGWGAAEVGKGWGKEIDDLRVLLERERVQW